MVVFESCFVENETSERIMGNNCFEGKETQRGCVLFPLILPVIHPVQ